MIAVTFLVEFTVALLVALVLMTVVTFFAEFTVAFLVEFV
jgi:hypothetical protein